jgi:hypothetical protein
LRSARYGAAEPAPVCTFSFAGGAQEAYTFLVPRAAGAPESRVREVEAIGGRAFELNRGAGRDVLLVRAEGARSIETARLVSDFDWLWLRFEDDDETRPHEFVAVGGQALRLDGREIVRAGSRFNYLVARRAAGGEVFVDTDAGAELSLALSAPASQEERKGVNIG